MMVSRKNVRPHNCGMKCFRILCIIKQVQRDRFKRLFVSDPCAPPPPCRSASQAVIKYRARSLGHSWCALCDGGGPRIHHKSFRFFLPFPGHHKPASQQKNKIYHETAKVRQVGAVTWKPEEKKQIAQFHWKYSENVYVVACPSWVKAWLPPKVLGLSSSVQLFQHRWDIDQAQLAAEVTDDRRIVQNQDLAGRLGLLTLPQVDRL